MTARPIRRNAQTPDRNGKIFYTSTTSLSHISKFKGLEADAVILVDVDKTTFTGNDGQNVLLYYVGTSRARLRLDVIAQLDDSDCLAVLEALDKAGKAKRPRRDLARALNAVAQIAD